MWGGVFTSSESAHVVPLLLDLSTTAVLQPSARVHLPESIPCIPSDIYGRVRWACGDWWSPQKDPEGWDLTPDFPLASSAFTTNCIPLALCIRISGGKAAFWISLPFCQLFLG